MTAITTRAGKGSPLTNVEVDNNFTALNAGKIETSLLAAALGVATLDASGYLLAAQISPTFNAATVTTNANLTGPITSVGNATSINSQTGTGSTFVMSVSPTLTGTPAAPTAAVNTNTTQLATTAFVAGQASATNPLMNGSVAVGTSLRYAREDHVHASDTSRAPTASPTFTGTATFNIISAAGQINSTLATGTAPLVIASTTQVANLNVSFLEGGTWAIPGAIGATTANSAAFTSLSVSAAATFSAGVIVNGRLAVMAAAGVANMGALFQPTTASVTPLTGVMQFAAYANLETTTAATTAGYGYASRVSSAAAVYTMPIGGAYVAFDGTKGAGSTYTEQNGFRCTDLTVAATNIGFRSMVTSGSNKWNAYFDGTAQNYFAGLTGFGISTPTYPVDVVAAAATAIGIRIRGRVADDLAVLSFSEDSGATEQGRISVTSANAINFATGSAAAVQVSITHVASAVNYVNLAGATTTNPPFIAAGGSDSNIALRYISKGTGNHDFYSVNGANRQFRVRGDNVAVNYLDVFGTTTGNGPIIRAEGSDTNIRLNLYSKGTESVVIGTNQGAQAAAAFAHIASAVNYLLMYGSITGSAPAVRAEGSDTNIALNLSGKGTGAVNLYTGSAARLQVSVIDVAGANRYVTLAGSNSGNPTIGVSGGSLALSAAVIGASTIACTAGTGTGQPVLIGKLSHDTTEVYNNTTGADDLMTYSLPASSMSANNKAVRVTAAGTFVNTAGVKGVRLIFGSTTIIEYLTFPTLSNGHWRIEAIITRTGSSAQVASAVITITDTTGTTTSHTAAGAAPGESTAGAITIKCQAQSTGTDDIYQYMSLVEFIN